jgi:hypothetical protein
VHENTEIRSAIAQKPPRSKIDRGGCESSRKSNCFSVRRAGRKLTRQGLSGIKMHGAETARDAPVEQRYGRQSEAGAVLGRTFDGARHARCVRQRAANDARVTHLRPRFRFAGLPAFSERVASLTVSARQTLPM